MKEIRHFSGGYRELFPVKSNPELHTGFYVALSSDGELLYVTECDVCRDATMMNMEKEVRVYSLEKEEYRTYLERAKRTGISAEPST